VAAYQKKYGKNAAITDPMAHAYMDVYLWKAAVEKAKSFDPVAVRKAIVGISMDSPLGKITVDPNGSLTQAVYTGISGAGGQFKVVSQSKGVVAPQPYDKLAFPGKTCP